MHSAGQKSLKVKESARQEETAAIIPASRIDGAAGNIQRSVSGLLEGKFWESIRFRSGTGKNPRNNRRCQSVDVREGRGRIGS